MFYHSLVVGNGSLLPAHFSGGHALALVELANVGFPEYHSISLQRIQLSHSTLLGVPILVQNTQAILQRKGERECAECEERISEKDCWVQKLQRQF